MIAIVDYDTGNLRSVCNALKRIGAEYIITSDPAQIANAERVLLPGVGEASTAMAKLNERGLCDVIRSLKVPVLGICIGMQLMCKSSEEGNAECMGIFNTRVKRFIADNNRGIKVPHMGWNEINHLTSPLFNGIEEDSFIYFVHSFAPEICEHTIALSENGLPFSAALNNGNFYGTQFHPEKSGEIGDKILKNFIKL